MLTLLFMLPVFGSCEEDNLHGLTPSLTPNHIGGGNSEEHDSNESGGNDQGGSDQGGGSEEEIPYLTVNPLLMTFAAKDAEAQTFTVSSNVTYSVATKASWIDLSQGENEWTVTTDENSSEEVREDSIVVSSINLRQVVKILQVGKDVTYVLGLSQDTMHVSSEDVTRELTVTGNDTWTASTLESWISIAPKQGEGERQLTVMMTANQDSDPRIGCVMIKGEKSQTELLLEITQSGSVSNYDMDNGHEYVDLGLPSGMKWSTCNLGANRPEEYGDYYAWGETMTKNNYSWSNYKWCSGSGESINKYCVESKYGTVDNKTILEPEDDVVCEIWGGSWRLPTDAEMEELTETCTWTWIIENGVSGYKVTGPNSNSIFLPAAGYYNESSLKDVGSNGCYWSRSVGTYYSNDAYSIDFVTNNLHTFQYRNCGLSIRPVSQLGVTYHLSLDRTNLNFNFSKESQTINVMGNDSWYLFSDVSWLGLSMRKGRGSSEITITCYAHNNPDDRTGTITVMGDNSMTLCISVTQSGKPSDNMENGHEYVDLGLPSGLMWATCNVGAGRPEEYGDYFAWGETETKTYYDWSEYKWSNSSGGSMSKYCTSIKYGTVDNKTVLELDDDTAHVKWAGAWRMPTYEEFAELIENCSWTKTIVNGVIGYKGTGPNGNSLFLPASGYRFTSNSISYDGESCNYWTSSLRTDYNEHAYELYIFSNRRLRGHERYYGKPVRPVFVK